ncbi:MAG: IS256 family transposase, partial [Desulfomonilaceae bacterium]
EAEGAKFWLSILNEIKNSGFKDILIACVDGLRGCFPNDEAMFKLLYLALRNATTKWIMPIKDWKMALNKFSIIFEVRLPNF